MEDSYNVHRRRKAAAAARKREKTPEPSSRQGIVEASDDEEEASRRARMERMVEDSEKLEMENRIRLETSTEQTNEPVLEEGKSVPVETRRGQEVGTGSGTRESDGGEEARREAKPQETNRESVNEDAKGQEALSRHKETADDNVKTLEPRKVERRLKKRSKERLEKQAGSTDSSDMEDRLERSPRRTKSPDGSKIRARKTVAKTVTRSSGDPEVPTGRKETIEKPPREKKQPGARPRNEETGNGERRHSRKCSNTDDTDDERRMKKSETFPRGSSTKEEQPIKRSATELKKQIIPLSNDSLIEDFAKAQREYLMRERSILDPDPTDVYQDANEEQSVRRRKTSLGHSESERERTMERARGETVERTMEKTAKRSWFSWIPILGRGRGEKQQDEKKADKEEKVDEKPSRKLVEVQEPEKVTLMDFFRALRDVVAEFKAFVDQNPRETRVIRLMRNRCASELLAMIIYCGLGAFVFRFTEGAFESFYKCGVKRVKRDFLDSLWNYSHNLREEDWKSMARRKLMEFEEQLHTAHEAGVHTYSGQRSWSFLNAVAYCLTVVTTIGYGHISPKTTTGRVITIIYAIFGIPMFLIVLADFGKLFTRGIKFLWAFVRRLYYTGSCRKVRRTGPVQEVMKGVQLVYDLATFRRPSQMNPEDIEEIQRQAAVQQAQQAVLNIDGNVPPDTPGTPAMSAFAIDDEFNLPISVAISILLGYIFIGATLYYMWEDWGFFESFYFVFISMSTIGFGDYVPKHPIYMMCSIIYLVFGLALTSMCINVVQVMLSDSFKQASQKIGATIGFEVVEDDGTVKPSAPPLVEVADVHVSVKESESSERIAPRAKQEDVDL